MDKSRSEKKLKVYCETSFGSYLNGHPTPLQHIATASVYGMDVLLTWNCTHMANPVTLPKTAATIGKAGFNCPVIITPVDFLARREEFGI